MVPTDFSDSATNALRYGVSFSKEYKAQLLILHVVDTLAIGYASDLFPMPMADVYKEITTHAQNEIQALANDARSRGVDVEALVVQGKPSAEIVRVAREREVDMIVLGAHG